MADDSGNDIDVFHMSVSTKSAEISDHFLPCLEVGTTQLDSSAEQVVVGLHVDVEIAIEQRLLVGVDDVVVSLV